jgi:hypothetical protein
MQASAGDRASPLVAPVEALQRATANGVYLT